MPQPTAGDVHRAVGIFKALAHPKRIRLACALADRRASTQKQLLEELGWPQSTTARHLAALRDQGLVRAKRHGNQVLLELDGTVTPHLLTAVCAWVHPETGDQFSAHFAPGTR